MPTDPKTAIVKEVYDGDNSPEVFEQELEKALYENCEIIIIEPTRLADETVRWIKVGNCLHRIAVYSGLSSVCINVIFYRNPNSSTIYIPLTVASVLCAGLYMISWQFDPCCKYQVANTLEKLNATEFSPENLYYSLLESTVNMSSSYHGSPVILIKKDDTARKIFHTAVAIIAFTLTVFRAYK